MRYGYRLLKVSDDVYAFFGRTTPENKGGRSLEVMQHMAALGFDFQDIEDGFIALEGSDNLAEYGIRKTFMFARKLDKSA